jgi:hypothetical protein
VLVQDRWDTANGRRQGVGSGRWDTTLERRRLSPRGVKPPVGPWQGGSLTGAVASQMVTEAPQGSLSPVGHRAGRVKAQESLTASATARAGTKVGLSDPVAPRGRAIAQRTKVTPGITG